MAGTIGDLYPHTSYSFYPNRPLFTLLSGITLAGVSTLGAMSFSVYLGRFILIDDMVMYPIQRLRKLTSNITNDVKTAKSWIGIFTTLLGYALGALFAAYALANIPLLTLMFSAVINAMGCSLIVLVTAQLLGLFVANALHRPAYEGVLLATLLAGFIPIALPIMVEIYGLSIITCGFLGSYFSKQGMRLLYFFRYGETNADGYYFNSDRDNQTQSDINRALRLNVKPEVFSGLRHALLKTLDCVKDNTSFLQRFLGHDSAITAELKNILHHMMTAHTPEQIADFVTLLAVTSHVTAATNANIPDYEADILRSHQRITNSEKNNVDTSAGLAKIKQNHVCKPFCDARASSLEGYATYHQHGIFSAIAISEEQDKFRDYDLHESIQTMHEALSPGL